MLTPSSTSGALLVSIQNFANALQAHVNHGDESLTVTALRPIKPGEEILNYYGPHPNSELLRRYGYVTRKHSRYDVVEIPWSLVLECMKRSLLFSEETLNSAVRFPTCSVGIDSRC